MIYIIWYKLYKQTICIAVICKGYDVSLECEKRKYVVQWQESMYCDSISNSERAIRFGALTRSRRSPLSILPSLEIARYRFFFIYRCLPPKTHASHHYKIADYSRSRRGAFLPVHLDRLERGIENGSERSRFRFKTEECGRGGRRRGLLIGGIRRPLRGWMECREREGTRRVV